MAWAGAVSLLAGTLIGGLALAGVQSGWALLLPQCLFMIGHGVHQPCGQSGAVGPFPLAAGAASAVNGFLMMLAAFAVGSWLGTRMDGTVLPLALGVWFWSVLIALVAYIPIMLAFAYAPLLVAWRGFGVSKALFFSFVASWRAWPGLLGLFSAIMVFGVLLPSLVMMLLLAVGVGDALVTSLVVVPIMAVLAPTVVSAFLSSYNDVLPEVPKSEGAVQAQNA